MGKKESSEKEIVIEPLHKLLWGEDHGKQERTFLSYFAKTNKRKKRIRKKTVICRLL